MEKRYNKELQERTRAYVEAGTSQAELSRRLGMNNSSSLSRWLNSSYNGDVDYVPTSISEDVFQSIRYCQLHRCVTVLHGDAGVGKTKGAEKFLRENPSSTVYISMTPSTASLNGVCRALAKALKIGGKHNRMDMMEEVRTRLAGTNKVVIVDEAQHLKLPAIEELRSLSDPDIVTGTPGNGVCLIGNSEVYDRIRGKAQAEFAQIFTRVKMPRQYRSSRITKEDVRSLFPAVSDEKELAVLLGVARSVYSIRTAQDIYMKAVELNDTSCEGLRRVAKALQVNPAL